jgi:hypothetical protein
MLVDPALDAHVQPLRVLAADRGRALRPIRPLVGDHDDPIAVAHFRMHDLALGIRQYSGDIEAESLLQPLEGCGAVPVDEGRNESRARQESGGHGKLLALMVSVPKNS